MSKPSVQINRQINFADKQYQKVRMSYWWDKLETLPQAFSYFHANKAYQPFSVSQSITDVPQNWLVWANFYSRYLVKGVKVTFKVIADTDAPPALFSVWPSSSAQVSTPVNLDSAAQTYAKQRIIGLADGGRPSTNISIYMSTRKMLGFDYLDLTDLAFPVNNASPTSPPAQFWFFNWDLAALDGTSALSHFVFVDIIFYVEFFDRFDST